MNARIMFSIFFLGVSTHAQASADNLGACVSAVKDFANKSVDEFDAEYEDNFLSNDVAKWEGVSCEVKLESVQQLTVDGQKLIVDGFAGEEAKAANSQLAKDTERAIAKLESRIALLEQRMEKARTELKSPNPEIENISSYIQSGIEKAL